MKHVSGFAVALLAAAAFASPLSAETMAVDGAELPYVSAGEGTPVVFVHGAISDHRVWLPLKDEIASERHFVAFDQRHYGTSDWGEVAEDFSADVHADDLIAMIEGLDAGPVHLVTWSYSGDIGSRAALKRPDLFRAIVHYEPAIGSVTEGLPGAKAVTKDLFSNFGPAMKAVREERFGDSALRFLDAVFELETGSADNEPEPWPTIWRENGHTVPIYLGQKPGDSVTCDKLSGLRVPTLVVLGANSHPRYAMMAERVAACQPNAVLVTMEGVNHDGPYRKPDELAEMIDDFLDLVE